jgi:hypothetical protein
MQTTTALAGLPLGLTETMQTGKLVQAQADDRRAE